MDNLQKLEKERDDIQSKINKIRSVAEAKRTKEMELLVGVCLEGEYADARFRKILEFVYHKEYGIYFIFEEVEINEQGEASIKITSGYPYTNKEWNGEKIPVSGWTQEITEAQYQQKKAMVMNEMASRGKLRKFLANNK